MLAAQFGPFGEFVLGGGGFHFAGEAEGFGAVVGEGGGGGRVGGWERCEEVVELEVKC